MSFPEASAGAAVAGVRLADPGVDEADVEAVARVLRSGWLTTGEECAALERDLAAYLSCPHVVALSSCTAAMETAMAWMGLRPGARVGVPAWTFAATALAAVHAGAVPVLLDVDPSTLNVSPASVEAALGSGLDMVVPVHFGGVPADRAVHELCGAAGVPVLEDAAHAFGASDHRGRLWGDGSVAACFSFYATKNMTAAEGGALATDSPDLAAFARRHRAHGLSSEAWGRHEDAQGDGYDCAEPGIKANLPDVLAALARSQLARFDASQARRRELVARYRSGLSCIEGLGVVPSVGHLGSADHLMVVVLPQATDRGQVMARLAASGIQSSVHFKPLHHLSWFRAHAEVGPGGLAVSDAFAPRVLSLPLHVALNHADVDRACESLSRALRP